MSVFFVGSHVLVMVCANNTLPLSGMFVTDCPESTITFAFTGMVQMAVFQPRYQTEHIGFKPSIAAEKEKREEIEIIDLSS